MGLNKKLAEQAGYYGTPEQNARMDAEALAEICRKLAEWAGFKNFQWSEDEEGFIAWSDEGSYREWLDFTESLDACFAWLIPKLKYVSLQYDSKLMCLCSVDDGNMVGTSEAPTLALALCLAIEKIIEAEDGN